MDIDELYKIVTELDDLSPRETIKLSAAIIYAASMLSKKLDILNDNIKELSSEIRSANFI